LLCIPLPGRFVFTGLRVSSLCRSSLSRWHESKVDLSKQAASSILPSFRVDYIFEYRNDLYENSQG
jgi:hypothetical protein